MPLPTILLWFFPKIPASPTYHYFSDVFFRSSDLSDVPSGCNSNNCHCSFTSLFRCFTGSEVKASACSAGDLGSIPGLGRFPGEGNGNPLQDSCLENSMDGGAWWATVPGVTKSQTRLSDFTSLHLVAKSCPTLCDPWTSACQASLSSTISRSLLKFTSVVLVMLGKRLIFSCPLLLLP